MKNFAHLALQETNSSYKKIFEVLAEDQKLRPGVADAAPEQLAHSADAIETIKKSLWEEVRKSTALDGKYQTMDEHRKALTFNLSRLNKQIQQKGGMSADAFFNEFTGIGTGIDPGFYNNASIPIVVSPQEATSYYSNGGVPAYVIDKKSRGIFTNGYQFIGGLEEDELKELKDYADTINFRDAVIEWWRDGWIYGGSCLMAWLRGDNAQTHDMTIKQLAAAGMLKKDCIQYFWTADRWNSVLIPNYNISARDYLMPETFYIPLAGMAVRTERMAIAKPKRLPYWGTIRQMGWGISDFPSFMPSYLAYVMMVRAIPIISQQLSVVYLSMPIDNALAQVGKNALRNLFGQNQATLDQMNPLKPQVLNLAGDLKSIERHWTDFDKLILIGKQDVGANAGISHTILWNEQTASLDEKSFDTTLKQAETIKLSANDATIQIQNIIPFLVWSKWGYDSVQGQRARDVRISFEPPIVPTNAEAIEAMKAGTDTVVGLVGAGVQLGDAMDLVRKIVPKFELSEEAMKRIQAFDDAEMEFTEQQRQQTLELGAQKTDSTEGDNAGTGNPPIPAAASIGDSKDGWITKLARRLGLTR